MDEGGEEDDEDEEDEEDDFDDDDDDEPNELDQLVDALPAKLRQRVLNKKQADEASSDEEEAPEDEDEGWGRKKKAYYSADTADLEIGQDIEDAKDEEEAALELHKKTLSRMTEDDFFDDFGEQDDAKASKRKSKAKKGKGDKLMGELEDLALDSAPQQVPHFTSRRLACALYFGQALCRTCR